jgi:hypothetical protein
VGEELWVVRFWLGTNFDSPFLVGKQNGYPTFGWEAKRYVRFWLGSKLGCTVLVGKKIDQSTFGWEAKWVSHFWLGSKTVHTILIPTPKPTTRIDFLTFGRQTHSDFEAEAPVCAGTTMSVVNLTFLRGTKRVLLKFLRQN